jgi:hypothetical protein
MMSGLFHHAYLFLFFDQKPLDEREATTISAKPHTKMIKDSKYEQTLSPTPAAYRRCPERSCIAA